MRIGIVHVREPQVKDLFNVLSSGSNSAMLALGVRWHDRFLLRFSSGKTVGRLAQFFLENIKGDAAAGAPSKGSKHPEKDLTDAVIAVGWHYGFSYSETLSMPVKAFSKYVHQIERFRGLDLLAGAAVASIPYMKPGDRRKQLRVWSRMIQPGSRLNGSLGLLDLLRQGGKI